MSEAEKLPKVPGGLNASLIGGIYLNDGAKLIDLPTLIANNALPWPCVVSNNKAIVDTDLSKRFDEIADVVRLMGWAIKKQGNQPQLGQGQSNVLLDRVNQQITNWPADYLDDKYKYWDIVLTATAMFNAILAGNPGDGGGGNNGLPPD